MGDPYPIEPVDVPKVQTKYRRILSPIPHPDSVPILNRLRQAEPQCVEGQPPILWDRAEGSAVYDAWGNQWIDFSSGVLITNAGHGRKEIADAIIAHAQRPLLATFGFPHEVRAELVELLRMQATRPSDRVMLVTTGSEAVEFCIKLTREHARRQGKLGSVLVSFSNAFHGRTMGSQMAGGIPAFKEWMGYADEHFVNVPFPDGGVRCKPEENDFASFERSLRQQGIDPARVCGVLTESYQGGNSSFAPAAYIRQLAQWCRQHNALLIMDEVQAGFGRTGHFWAFEHYGVMPDLVSCGKGISGSLPLSAVIGREDIMNQLPPLSTTSTHSGNPVCCAAALANLKLILDEKLTERAARVGKIMQSLAEAIMKRHSSVIIALHGKGLVGSLHCVKPGTTEPDPTLAWEVIRRCVQQGVMLFAPVGYAGASVKLCPPLVIEEDALSEAMSVIDEAFAFVLASRKGN